MVKLRSNSGLDELNAIKVAKDTMENIGAFIKALNKVGGKLESGVDMMPKIIQKWLQKHVNKLLMGIVKTNIISMQKGEAFKKPSEKTYKALVTSSGAISGAFGSTTGVGTVIFLSELALSTKFMMRSIIDIARSHGENIQEFDTQLACMQVFALGGTSKDDDGAETSYYSTRVATNISVKKASEFIAKNGLSSLNKAFTSSTNPILKFIGSIAARFMTQVSEKFIAQAIPILGAAGGGAINLVFINHFQKMAEAHFSIRQLERKYGEKLVKEVYESIKLEKKN
ncbi:MAG TPA: EcsC family protein [Lutibacter sp.]|nr:EcsC family protein [Lutibacter sp.]